MEGACVYTINENDIYYDILFMYKEYSEYPGKVLVYIYKYNTYELNNFRDSKITSSNKNQVLII